MADGRGRQSQGQTGTQLRELPNLAQCARGEKVKAMDKELTDRLLDEMENLYIENLAMRSYIKALQRMNPNATAAESLIEAKRKSQDILAQAKELFGPLRAQIQAAQRLDDEILKSLRVDLAKKNTN